MSAASHPQPGSTAALRDANARRILATLRDAQRRGPGLSQAQLARMTELAPATVSGIVRAMETAGLVDVERGSGRRGAEVRIGRRAGLVAGVDIGHSHVAVALADLAGDILAQRRVPIASDHEADDALEVAAALLKDGAGEAGASLDEIRQVGLGLAAPLSHGIVQSPGILPGWIGLDAAQVAAGSLGMPVVADNDANLSAIAEMRRGAPEHRDSLVFVKVSSGVGAGIVLNGRLQVGATGMAGELGHVTVEEAGPFCRCGNRGCLEAYVSVPHLLSALSETLPDTTFPDVIARARAGHPAATRALEDVGLHLGRALSTVINLLEPNALVVGGEIAIAGELLLIPLRATLRRYCLDAMALQTEVSVTRLGEDAGVIGAVEAALDSADLLHYLA